MFIIFQATKKRHQQRSEDLNSDSDFLSDDNAEDLVDIDSSGNGVKKYYLKFESTDLEHYSKYSRDDIWIICASESFSDENNKVFHNNTLVIMVYNI